MKRAGGWTASRSTEFVETAIQKVKMKLKFFSIPVFDSSQSEEALNKFCTTHRVNHVDKQFVANGHNSFWAIAVTYVDSEKPLPASAKRSARIDYKEVLSPEDFDIYVQLRDLRASISEQEGIPAYAIFNNEQLSQIVLQKISSKTELRALDGIGEGKVSKYGEAFLEARENASHVIQSDET